MSQENTVQEQFWQGEFGESYLERNRYDVDQLDSFYVNTWGVPRSAMNLAFLPEDRDIRILEVGCNVGNQLRMLSHQGYQHLTGIEISHNAARLARQWNVDANIHQGSALELPFRDGWFDLVFTSGVLIHIHPDDLATVMGEIHRVSKRWIFGFEYYSPEPKAIPYRGHNDRLWKRDFRGHYQSLFPGLRTVKEEHYPYVADQNVDQMFLLEKS